MTNQNQKPYAEKDTFAKVELDIAGTRYVGSINLKHIPAVAVKLFAYPLENYIGTGKVIAVDFDGTLFTDAYPAIGEPLYYVIDFIKNLKAAGNKIVLWTCRCAEFLDAAVLACNEFGLIFDAVNDNVQSNIDKYGNNCRKVWADIYIDNKSFDFASLVCVDFPKPYTIAGVDLATTEGGNE